MGVARTHAPPRSFTDAFTTAVPIADTVNPVRGFTMHELYERTQVKTTFLKQQGWQVVEMWESEFHHFIHRNPMAKTCVDSLKEIVDPLNPRDAFYGHRVNATKLLVKTESTTTKIKYMDFTSLYPDINKNGVYPVGHPTILTENIHPHVSPYFGLVQCDVLAPRGLYHPVLQTEVCSVPHLRPRWSADVLVPTRGRTTHLHRDVGEPGIEPGLGDGVQGHDDSRCHSIQCRRPNGVEENFKQFVGENGSTP